MKKKKKKHWVIEMIVRHILLGFSEYWPTMLSSADGACYLVLSKKH